MSVVRALVQKILEINVRKLEEPDIWKLYHLVHFYKALVSKGVHNDSLNLPDQNVSLKEKYKIVYAHIKEQMISVLHQHKSSEHVIDGAPNVFGLRPHPCTEAVEIPGVDLLVQDRPMLPGSFICFFPGKVYVPSQLREIPDIPNGNPYLMARTDGSIIDAMEHSLGNPLAVGHLIRHPPQGTSPNVMPFSFDIMADFPKDLLSLVPNSYHRKPSLLLSNRKVVLRTIVFVATEYIRDGEELFLNYRLHPDAAVPDWYKRVEGANDDRRWT